MESNNNFNPTRMPLIVLYSFSESFTEPFCFRKKEDLNEVLDNIPRGAFVSAYIIAYYDILYGKITPCFEEITEDFGYFKPDIESEVSYDETKEDFREKTES